MSFSLGMGIGLVFEPSRGGAPGFDPASLFSGSEAGLFYDPVDLSTMFQDRNGVIAVSAATNPIGLRLDKSKGQALGSDIVVNGDFSSAAGWTLNAGFSIAAGVLSGTVGTTAAIATRAATFVQGALYRVELQITPMSAGALTIVFGIGTNVSSQQITTSGAHVFYMKPGSDNAELRVVAIGAGFTGSIDSIAIRPVAGGHADQALAGLKPLYQTAPPRAVFDAVDDLMTATFTTSLGSSCTVGRSVPGVGASILTGQTIGTSYALSTTDSGLVIVNRALTGPETAGLTSFLEDRAFF